MYIHCECKTNKMDPTRMTIHVLLAFLSVCAHGSYLVQLRVTSYANPLNRCAECSIANPLQGPFGCCDGFGLIGVCSESERCDNYFKYCLRDYATPPETLGCTLGGEITSDTPEGQEFNRDTDFSSASVLGLENPLSLQGVESLWQGVQLYIQAIDYDPDNGDDLIDTFAVDISPSLVAGSPDSSLLRYSGRFNLARILLSYRILCQQFFYGDSCQNYDECAAQSVACQNNGVCINKEDNFRCQCRGGYSGQYCENVEHCFGVTCTNRGKCQEETSSYVCFCDSGFTGQLCETEIDECVGVNCTGRGECADGLDTFSCFCNPGYTGQLCETEVNECEIVNCSGRGQCKNEFDSFNCICDPGYTGQLCTSQITTSGDLPVPELAGGIIGGVIFIILIFVSAAVVAYLLKRQRDKKEITPSNLDDYHAYGHDNTVHRRPMTPQRYVRASFTNSLSNSTHTGVSLQSYTRDTPMHGAPWSDQRRSYTNSSISTAISLRSYTDGRDNPIYGAPHLPARNSYTSRSNTSIATGISLQSDTNGRDNTVYAAPDGGQLPVRNSYTSRSNISIATGITLLSQTDLSGSDEQIYAEPILHTTNHGGDDCENERDFQNPLYQSSEDITDNDGKTFSFVGATGIYLSTLQDNECLI